MQFPGFLPCSGSGTSDGDASKRILGGKVQAWLSKQPPATPPTAPLWTFRPVCEDHRGHRRPCWVSGLCLHVPLTSPVFTGFLGSLVALGCQEILILDFQFRVNLPDLWTVPPDPKPASFSLSGVMPPPALCARLAEVWGAPNASWVLPMRPSCPHDMGKAVLAAQTERLLPRFQDCLPAVCTLDGS